MQRYSARDLMTWPFEQLKDELNEQPLIELELDDGVFVVGGRKTIYSSLYWDLHREFPELPLTIDNHMYKKTWTNGLHRSMLGRSMWQAFDSGLCRDLDYLNKLTMCNFNNIYNQVCYNLEEYVTTITVWDYRELCDHPRIKEAMAKIQRPTDPKQPWRISENDISRTYDVVVDVIMRDPDLRHNAICQACRCGLVGLGQVKQAIGPRGFVTDYDSMIFHTPIVNSFAEGIRRLGDSIKESRSGTKAAMSQKSPLEKTEYFGRKVQLLNEYVQKLHPGDCGTPYYTEFHVTKRALKRLNGKFHIVDFGKPSQHLEEITTQSYHLEGKMVKLRSPLTCKHAPSLGFCETCGGSLTYSMPSDMYWEIPSVIGHLCAIAMCSFVTQSVMSVKHEDSSAGAEQLLIQGAEMEYIECMKQEPNLIKFKNKLKQFKPKLVIMDEFIKHLPDVFKHSDVSTLSTATLAEIEFCTMKTHVTRGQKNEERTSPPLVTSINDRKAVFTHEFLDYLRVHGWETNSKQEIVIDLQKWNFSRPVFALPMKHVNTLDYMLSVQAFLENSKNNCLARCTSKSEALRALYDTVNREGTDVNILHLEVLLLAALCNDAETMDANPPALTDDFDKAVFFNTMQTMKIRNPGPAMGFGYHGDIFKSPVNHLRSNTPDHQMGALMGGV